MEKDIDTNATAKELNPWFSMWIRPRQTTRQVLKSSNGKMVFLLVTAAGIGQILDSASSRSLGDRFSIPFIFGASIIGGAIFGMIGLYISSILIKWTGKWIGGKATYDEIQTALAWSNIPLVWALLLWIPAYLLFGNELFTIDTYRIDSSLFLVIALLIYGLIELVIGVWYFVIMLKCVGEVQGFSAWKAWLNVIIGGLVPGLPLIIVVIIALTWI